MINYLTEEDILYLHFGVMKSWGEQEQAGVLFQDRLLFAIERPSMVSYGVEVYPTIWLKIASLIQSIAQGHPFHNGNKRTSLVCLHAFLLLNAYTLSISSLDAENFMVDVVTNDDMKGNDGVFNIAKFIEGNSKKLI